MDVGWRSASAKHYHSRLNEKIGITSLGILYLNPKNHNENFFIQFKLEIPADAQYRQNAADLKDLNTLFFLFPLSPDLLGFGEWADLHRMRYDSQEEDKVEIKTKKKDGIETKNLPLKYPYKVEDTMLLRIPGIYCG